MGDVIRLLPDAVANQIAAGEVIQRPASVLKELVENAIDAGSGYIQIVIRDGGRSLIQVTDDGRGMSETDARMAFERHATSKIKDAGDLFVIKTMGFRGEALASIASVAQVELRTRRKEDELGTMVEIAGSRIFKQEAVQCQCGTTFSVKNLFFNVPARRRFLKSDSVERNHLFNEFYRIVLVNPEVEFSLFDGDEEVFHLPVSNVKMRIEQVFHNHKKKLSQQLLSIEAETGIVNIRGFIGKPESAQKNAQQYFFVNGRYMRHPYFHKAVMLAYNQLILATDNPLYFIYFEVDPQTIDINIHPTKTEIKFENEQVIWSILNATIREALGKFNVIPSIDFDTEGVPDMPLPERGTPIIQPQSTFNPSYNPFGSGGYKRPALDWQDLYQNFENKSTAEKTSPVDNQELEQEVIQSKLNIPEEINSGKYFQLKNKYIITSVKSGMMVVDQHRAHIRILFDEYLMEINQKKGFSQQLIFPEEVFLMAEDVYFFDQLKQDLKSTGFEISKISEGHLQIQGVPAQLKTSENLASLLQGMIEQVKSSTGDAITEIQEQIALSLAQSSAIQSGQKLTDEAMKDMIDRLFNCQVHQHTPDGKQIIVIVTLEELASKFR